MDLIIFNIVMCLLAIGGFWVASQDTKPTDSEHEDGH